MPVGAKATSVALLHICSVFPTGKVKQMILTSFSDVTNAMLMQRVGGIEGEHTQAPRLSSRFLELNILETC